MIEFEKRIDAELEIKIKCSSPVKSAGALEIMGVAPVGNLGELPRFGVPNQPLPLTFPPKRKSRQTGLWPRQFLPSAPPIL